MAEHEPARASHLVVVGSSAGGIEALSTLLGSLPARFPAALVLAQHLDPARPSYLTSILSRRSQLPVVLVEQRTPLEAGKVYVVASNRHVVIEDGHVNVDAHHGDRPRPSVDLLLSSAARSYGEQLVAVILTGSGSDGAAGAVEVKSLGGVVVIQNPATATHPAMPLALPPTVVDHVADLHDLGALITGLVSEPPGAVREDLERKDLITPLLEMVSRHSNIDFQSYKPSTIVRRIGRRMAVNNFTSLQEYSQHAQKNRQELSELARSFLIKVTDFFRDPDAFEYLRQDLLPRLIASGRERNRTLRLWSAGCATGEEAYSLAMLVSDALGEELGEWTVRIFATDLDESAVGFARRGLYPENVLRHVTDAHKDRYFERAGPGYRVKRALRQLVVFGHQDLSRGAPFPRIDLVVCRNLLIYFKPELQQDLLDLFAYALHHHAGYLFLGKAETARPARGTFDLINRKWKVYRCMSGPAGPPSSARTHPTALARVRGTLDLRSVEGTDLPSEANLDLLHLRRLNELVLRYLPAGVVVIDRSYRILSVNATARRVFNIREPVNEQDFLHAVRGLPYATLRDAIDRALRDASPQTLADVELEASGQPRHVTIRISPVSADANQVETVVLSVTDTTEAVLLRQQLTSAQSEQRQLVEDLSSTNARLKRSNDELQEANEELQGANEELLLAQEELQATNEEFEATNEELQATNEEMETNNEELQATNEELETTNEELTARTTELQEATVSLALERVRLAEVIEVAPFTIIILRGPDLTIEATGGKPGKLLARDAVGRTFEDVCLQSGIPAALAGAREAYDKNRLWAGDPMPVQLPDGGSRTFVFAMVPTHDGAGAVSGVVVYGQEAAEKPET